MLQATPFGHPHGAAELPGVSQQVHGLHDAFGKTSGGVYHGWGVPKSWGHPKRAIWMVYFMEIPMKMDDLGVPLFQEATWRLNSDLM